MAFRFDFDIPDEELANVKPGRDECDRSDSSSSQGTVTPPATATRHEYVQTADGLDADVARLDLHEDTNGDAADSTATREISIDDLLDNLPPVLSCSPISVPIASTSDSNTVVHILRRDLFDARFQLANQEDDSDDEGSAFGNMIPRNDTPPKAFQIQSHLKENAPSDLIKGVYEGGLKTWEASLDLVRVLHQQGYNANGTGHSIEGKRILEVGCGTAVPTLYLLERLFRTLLQEDATAASPRQKEKTSIHLQDFNSEVLVYITFCNILLAFWHAKQHSNPSTVAENTATSLPEATKKSREELAHSAGVQYTAELDDEPDVDEITLTEEFVDSFAAFVKRHNIDFRFFGGSWQTFGVEEAYDVVLTSETVYEVDSLPHLVRLLQDASSKTHRQADNLTLVACKRVYFGVGGGEVAFRQEAERSGASVDSIWSGGQGVERTVMQVSWQKDGQKEDSGMLQS